MRIIAGEFRGRTFLPPASDATRPITDRAKQSIFDVLSPYIHGAHVFDCFAGTGSMGLECLSRGATHVTFFEADRSALQRLDQNLTMLKVGDRATVQRGDLFMLFTAPPASLLPADLIFFDPPYRFLREQPADLQAVASTWASRFLSPDGLIVFRHDAADELSLPPLNTIDRRQYGSMMIELSSLPKT